jgi:hypothetical protein
MPVGVTRLQLLHPKARAMLPGDEMATEILGTQGRVLRLLALSNGHSFPSEKLAAFLGYTTPSSVAPMIMQLRSKLGGARWGARAIQSDHGVGYQLDMAAVEVDAFEFRESTERLAQRYRSAVEPDDIPADEAEEGLDVIMGALNSWRGNPAIGLENMFDGEHQYYNDYDRLYDRAQWLRILLALRVGTLQHLRDSILLLENKVADNQSPDWEHWCLLIRAYHSTGNPSKVKETYARAKRYYDYPLNGRPVPHQIEDCYQRSQSHDESFDLSRMRSRPTLAVVPMAPVVPLESEAQSASAPPSRADASGRYEILMQVVDLIGITTHSELRLTGPKMEPTALMRRAKQRLWFSGVMASKWVADPAVRSQLSDFLTVLDHAPEGDVRFMIMNPDGPGYRRLRELRGDELSAEHLPILAQLAQQHNSFQVKVFDHLPAHRIHIIDRDVVTFSLYRLDEETYLRGDENWESPHVVLDPLAPWPLAEVFATLFKSMWQTSAFLDLGKYA